jgi:hypothetical protein
MSRWQVMIRLENGAHATVDGDVIKSRRGGQPFTVRLTSRTSSKAVGLAAFRFVCGKEMKIGYYDVMGGGSRSR